MSEPAEPDADETTASEESTLDGESATHRDESVGGRRTVLKVAALLGGALAPTNVVVGQDDDGADDDDDDDDGPDDDDGDDGPGGDDGDDDGPNDDNDDDDDDDLDVCEQPGLVTVRGGESVESTVECLRAAIESSDLTLLTTVDHAANAEVAGRDLPPTVLLLFGNPAVGTPLMQERRSVGIDLPQKLLVREDDGVVRVTYNDPRYLAARHDIDDQDDRLRSIRSTLDAIAAECRDG